MRRVVASGRLSISAYGHRVIEVRVYPTAEPLHDVSNVKIVPAAARHAASLDQTRLTLDTLFTELVSTIGERPWDEGSTPRKQ